MEPQQQIQINFNEDIRKGRYVNFIQVAQSQSEATLDFIFVHPQTGGDIVARVIVTPDFLKQIAELLTNQSVQTPITQPNVTKRSQIGFQPKNSEDETTPNT